MQDVLAAATEDAGIYDLSTFFMPAPQAESSLESEKSGDDHLEEWEFFQSLQMPTSSSAAVSLSEAIKEPADINGITDTISPREAALPEVRSTNSERLPINEEPVAKQALLLTNKSSASQVTPHPIAKPPEPKNIAINSSNEEKSARLMGFDRKRKIIPNGSDLPEKQSISSTIYHSPSINSLHDLASSHSTTPLSEHEDERRYVSLMVFFVTAATYLRTDKL